MVASVRRPNRVFRRHRIVFFVAVARTSVRIDRPPARGTSCQILVRSVGGWSSWSSWSSQRTIAFPRCSGIAMRYCYVVLLRCTVTLYCYVVLLRCTATLYCYVVLLVTLYCYVVLLRCTVTLYCYVVLLYCYVYCYVVLLRGIATWYLLRDIAAFFLFFLFSLVLSFFARFFPSHRSITSSPRLWSPRVPT